MAPREVGAALFPVFQESDSDTGFAPLAVFRASPIEMSPS
jgi:hypothetical protein